MGWRNECVSCFYKSQELLFNHVLKPHTEFQERGAAVWAPACDAAQLPSVCVAGHLTSHSEILQSLCLQ